MPRFCACEARVQKISSQAFTINRSHSRNNCNLEQHFVRAIALLEGELSVQVRLQQGLGSDRRHEPSIYCLLVCLALVRYSGALHGAKQRGKRKRGSKSLAQDALLP